MLAIILGSDQPTLSTRAPWLESYLGAVLIVGLLSMVVIQMVKDFFPVRSWFQGDWISDWIKRRSPANHSAREVEEDLIRCAGEGHSSYLYNLPVEQLCGQINVYLQAALENPEKHEPLIRVFASTANEDDLLVFLRERPSLVVREDMADTDRKKIEDYAQARNRVAHHVERAVDGLQIAMGSRLKFLLQTTSIVLSLIFASLGFGRTYWRESPGAAIRDTFSVGLIAGYLAPVARDILARIQQGAR